MVRKRKKASAGEPKPALVRVEALVKPELLRWARENAGVQLEVAAKGAAVKPEQLRSWEQGTSRPSIPQLRKLGRVYKRPLAVFYLPRPPQDFDAIRDLRRLPGRVAGIQSPALRYEIRRAHSRRELAIELYESTEGHPPELPLHLDLTANPEDAGTAIRNVLGISHDQQVRWIGLYDSFNNWRLALENVGILAFQFRDVDVSEARGFSISKTPLPAVAINISDPPRTRTFTLLHEFTHILLRESGLCDIEEGEGRPPEADRIEAFCNHVAGAALVPQEYLLAEELVRGKGRATEWPEEEIEQLAVRYGVSREALLRRLLICGRTTDAFYQRMRRRWQEEYEAQAERARPGFASPDQIAVSTAGPFFVRLVLSNYHQDNITVSDVSDLLEVRLRHLPKIEARVLGAPLGTRAAS